MFSRLSLALVLICFYGLIPQTIHAQTSQKPNILFLCSDDQRPDALGALSHPVLKTPNLDKLMLEGTSFSRAYCMGSPHGAVCQPSRAMFNSGRQLFKIDLNLKDTPTWGQTMAAAGYQTFATGKWHNGPESFIRSFQSGKAAFFGGMSDHDKAPVQDLVDGKLVNKRTGDKFSSELFADAAIDFLNSRDKSRPFFLYCTFTAPHDPRMPPGEYAAMYDPAKIPLPANYLPIHPFDNGEMTVRDEALLGWPRTEAAVRKELADYYGMITHMDHQIGRILWSLIQTGVYDNTYIVFTSDHGLAVGSHGLLGKQNSYEHSTKSPLIFVGPGIPKARRLDAMCYLFDIFPTCCDFARVPYPREIDGISLANVITGKMASTRTFILTGYKDVQRAIRDKNWKLIRYQKVDKTQLFNLTTDPDEMRDLSADPANADQIKRLTALMKAAQEQFGDKAPLVVDKPASGEFKPPAPGKTGGKKSKEEN